MSRNDAADVFARHPDPDWEMFCRGRSGGDGFAPAGAPVEAPVELAPSDDEGCGSPAVPPPVPPAGAVVRHFHTRIVGIPYPNADGTLRRDAVRGLRRWARVDLAHRPDNPVDANAVAVLRRPDGFQLGYLPATVAKDVVAAARDRQTRYLALVCEVTGPAAHDLISAAPVGADLLVLALEGSATTAAARRYVLNLLNGG